MQVDLSTRKLKALAKRLEQDLALTPDQRRRTLDALARGLGHPSYAALKPALDAPAAPSEMDLATAVLGLLQDPGALADADANRLDHAAAQYLRRREYALCVMGVGDVATAIAEHEGRDEDEMDRERARHWMAGQGRELEESMAREANEALGELIALAPPPPRSDVPTENTWVMRITVQPAWADAPADPAAAARQMDDPGDARAVAQRDYWTLVEAEDGEQARERALDVFSESVPIKHLEDLDITAEPAESRAEIDARAAYCAGTYARVAAYVFLGRVTQ
jgi:hypothetical protein